MVVVVQLKLFIFQDFCDYVAVVIQCKYVEASSTKGAIVFIMERLSAVVFIEVSK